MIVSLTGTIVELKAAFVVLDVSGVGYEVGVSAQTASWLSHASSPVTVLIRMIVREDAHALYSFATRQERAVFDRLRAISGVGPKLALAVLSAYDPTQLVDIVSTKDSVRMAQVSGIGRKKAYRILLELEGAFAQDIELAPLLTTASSGSSLVGVMPDNQAMRMEDEVVTGLLAMGFTRSEALSALEGYDKTDITSERALLAYALKRLGERR